MRKEDHLLVTGLGIEFCLIMCVGFFAGYFADKKLDSSPLFTLIGTGLFFALALYVLINTALKISKKWEKPQDNKK